MCTLAPASLTLYMFSLACPKALSSVPYFSSSFSMTLLPFLFPTPPNLICADDVLFLHPANCPTDVAFLNLDLQTISLWLSRKSLHIKIAKSRYMFFPFELSLHLLTYLLFPSLNFWTLHINSLRSKVKRILGIICRHFYQSCSSSALLVLYKSLVKPIFEYCFILWDPFSITTTNTIESVQYIALKIVSKTLFSDYKSLLAQFQHRQKVFKVIEIFKLKHKLFHHPYYPNILSPHLNRFSKHYSPFDFTPTFCRTSPYYNLFYPSAIKIWNFLPNSIKQSFPLFY